MLTDSNNVLNVFTAVTSSFEDPTQPHQYLKITNQDGALVCEPTKSREERATLSQINEFVTEYMKTVNPSPKTLKSIEKGLTIITAEITDKAALSCCNISYWLSGYWIVNSSKNLIDLITSSPLIGFGDDNKADVGAFIAPESVTEEESQEDLTQAATGASTITEADNQENPLEILEARLASIYKKGEGQKLDLATAYEYYNILAAHYDEEAPLNELNATYMLANFFLDDKSSRGIDLELAAECYALVAENTSLKTIRGRLYLKAAELLDIHDALHKISGKEDTSAKWIIKFYSLFTGSELNNLKVDNAVSTKRIQELYQLAVDCQIFEAGLMFEISYIQKRLNPECNCLSPARKSSLDSILNSIKECAQLPIDPQEKLSRLIEDCKRRPAEDQAILLFYICHLFKLDESHIQRINSYIYEKDKKTIMFIGVAKMLFLMHLSPKFLPPIDIHKNMSQFDSIIDKNQIYPSWLKKLHDITESKKFFKA